MTMNTIRLSAMKERMYMQREVRRHRNFQKRMNNPELRQGRIDFLQRELYFSYLIWN